MQKIVFITVVALTATFSQAQTCQTKNTKPDSRYQLLNNGSEAKDLKTGLIWQRCSLGQIWDGKTCTGAAIKYSWQHALQAAKDAGNGFALPNIKELNSLVNRACDKPSINDTFFPNTPFDSISNEGAYWSSSPDTKGENWAWFVSFGGQTNSYAVNRSAALFVRLVRTSQ